MQMYKINIALLSSCFQWYAEVWHQFWFLFLCRWFPLCSKGFQNIFFVFFVPCELFYILGTRGESKTWALVPCVWRSKRSLQSPEIRHQSQKWGIGSNVGLLIQPDSEHILSSFLLRASIRQQERNIHPKSRRGHQQMRDAKAKD